MITENDLKDLITDEKVLKSVIELSKNKFETEKVKIEKETFGKALGNIDDILKEQGFEKKGKTSETVKSVIAELKAKIKTNPDTEKLVKEITELKAKVKEGGGNQDAIKELEEKNKELSEKFTDFKKESYENLTKLKAEYLLKDKRSKLIQSNPGGLEHLGKELQGHILSIAVNEIESLSSIDENGNLVFKDEHGAIIKNEKNEYKPKTVEEMFLSVPIYKENYKKNTKQTSTQINTDHKTTTIPQFSNVEEITDFAVKQNLKGDEFYDFISKHKKELS